MAAQADRELTFELSHGVREREELIRAFRIIQSSRRLDDREIMLKRQQRIYFQVSGAGHEAIQAAAAMATRPGYDWFYPYYRDRALCLGLGITPEMMLLQAVGSAEDTQSGGRQMPSHWSSPELHIVTTSSCTGTQFLQAVGCADAGRLLNRRADEVTLVTGGDGHTSEGEFWEALNIACLERLPVVFLIEDNGFAISVPVENQTAGGSISKLVEGFPNLLILEVDGCDFPASYETMKTAVAHCRQRLGPSLVHAHVIRPYSHSLSDDEALYKTEAERQAERNRDPFHRYPEWLLAESFIDHRTLERIIREVDVEIQRATERALKSEMPAPGSAPLYVYSDTVDPTSLEFETEPRFDSESRTMVDAINKTLADEMRRDERVIVFGEDVADCGREENLPLVKGKGGVFKATHGLQREFGGKRCFNSPLAEAAIVGRALGMATRGLKPVVEIQFFDYIWPATMQLRDEVANFRWRSYNGFSCPLVIRAAIGGYLTGGSIYHSQCGESIFTHMPGLRVVMPSNALDAAGLLRTAIRCDDPVLFLEHKKLYRETYNRSAYPGPDYMIPFGKAKIVKPGKNLTMIAYGALVQKCLQAALSIEARFSEWTVEIIDLRSLSPYDWEAIRESVEKTNRVMVVHEDSRSWGYGAEIAARIAGELFDVLDAPVGRIGSLDTYVAYNPKLEDEILPQAEDVEREGERLLTY
ncbi:MAG: dehydrogenase E1 component subunit alpha/beta [Bryobacteraceae bacterium]|nr:dehydrogenase E1 component subunit alpha/beta [Bryobacteraceae bacterium]